MKKIMLLVMSMFLSMPVFAGEQFIIEFAFPIGGSKSATHCDKNMHGVFLRYVNDKIVKGLELHGGHMGSDSKKCNRTTNVVGVGKRMEAELFMEPSNEYVAYTPGIAFIFTPTDRLKNHWAMFNRFTIGDQLSGNHFKNKRQNIEVSLLRYGLSEAETFFTVASNMKRNAEHQNHHVIDESPSDNDSDGGDDDGNNGHGDSGGNDDSNPGQGGGGNDDGDGSGDDDGNNGHGDSDGNDDSNPGQGGGGDCGPRHGHGNASCQAVESADGHPNENSY
jgi:hypothetical protein